MKPTPVFLPGESQGQRSLVGSHLWGCRVGHDWSDLAAAAAYSISSAFPPIYSMALTQIPTLEEGQREMREKSSVTDCHVFWKWTHMLKINFPESILVIPFAT